MKAFNCDKCGEYFHRERIKGTLQKSISFDGPRGNRTLSVDLLYRCIHLKSEDGYTCKHQVHFCDDCLLWLLEEYKGSIMVAVGGEENVTENARECASQA